MYVFYNFRSSSPQAKSPAGSSFGIERGDADGRPSSAIGLHTSGAVSKENPTSVSVFFFFNSYNICLYFLQEL